MKLHRLITAIIVCACFTYAHSGCATIREAAWPAAGAAGGAAVGSLGGPIGMIVGAAVGASIVAVTNQNDELRKGSLQGDGASELELQHLRQQYANAQGALRATESTLEGAHEALGMKDHVIADLYFWGKILAGVFVVFWIWSHPRGRAAVGAVFRAVTNTVSKAFAKAAPPTT